MISRTMSWALASAAFVALAAAPAAADGHRTMAPKGAKVYFVSLADGAVVSSPVKIVFGVQGMGVAPATVEHPKTGHHHLIVDAPLPDMNDPIPKDANYRHFGGGQTEATVELAPGTHTLQLLLGDHNHVPHEPPVASAKISITVK